MSFMIFQCVEEKNDGGAEEKNLTPLLRAPETIYGLHEREEYSVVPLIRNIIVLFTRYVT